MVTPFRSLPAFTFRPTNSPFQQKYNGFSWPIYAPYPVTEDSRSLLFFSSKSDYGDDSPVPEKLIYDAPLLTDPNEILAGFALDELGLDIAVAPSKTAPGTYGLFAALSPGVEEATVPNMAVLCGYSREGTFQNKFEGDKTVGFALAGPDTAVFYEQQLMSVLDALEMAARSQQEGGLDGACGLAGHVLTQDESSGDVDIFVDAESDSRGFGRYFVPSLMNLETGNEARISVGNLGQFCNDLAWSFDNPPESKEEYEKNSLNNNIVQLVWRLEFDEQTRCLVPSWPVSVISRDVVFKNECFMELGCKYGWNYWQTPNT